MVAKRGIMWDFQAQLDASFKRTFAEANKEVDALQKKMRFTVGAAPRSGGAGGAGGAGGSSGGAGKRDPREVAAERAMKLEAKWNRQAEAAAAKRERDEARAAERAEREAKRTADSQIRELRRVEREREKESHRRMQAGNRQLAALVRSGPQAVEQDRRRIERDQAEAQRQTEREARLATRERERADREQELAARRQAEAQNQVREGIYGTVHAFGQLTRAAAQFGVVGQRDMMRVLDTIFAVEGSINAVQGAMGAVRAIRGIRGAGGAAGLSRNLGPAAALSAGPAARLGGHLLNRAGLSSFGLAGGAGLAGAGATVFAAGGIGLAGSIADRRRGVAGNVGGFWDTVGTRGGGVATSLSGMLLRATASGHAAFNESYGLTSRQRELGREQFLEKQVGLDYIPGARTALENMKGERRERFTAEEIGNRAKQRNLRNRIDAEILPLEIGQRQARQQFAAERYGLQSAGIRARGQNIAGQLGEAFGRQQTAHGELVGLQARKAAGEFVDPAQLARAAAEQAREEGRVTSFSDRQRQNLLAAQNRAGMRGREIGEELTGARQRLETARGGNSQVGVEKFSREVLEAEERLKQNEQERLDIANRIRQVEVEGAQRELALRQQSLATAKQMADSLRTQKQSAMERFGNLNPMQRRATLEAARMFRGGVELQEPQLDLLRNQSEIFGPMLRERAEKKATEGGFEELMRLGGFDKRFAGGMAAEKQAIDVEVKARNEIAVKLDANTDAMAKELTERLTPIFKSIMQTAVNALEEQLTMAKGQDFTKAVEASTATGGP